MKIFLNRFVYLGSVSLLLLWPAFWNLYPLVYSDSGSYVWTAHFLKVALERPPGYGLFIHLFSGGVSLWFVVYAQALCAVYLLWKMVGFFCDRALSVFHYWVHFFIVLALALFTTLPWMVSEVMPDIFTSFIFLIFFLLIAAKISRFERAWLVLLLLFLLISHAANFLISLGFLAVTFLIVVLKKNDGLERNTYLRRTVVLACLTFIAPLFFVVANGAAGQGFVLNPASHIWMMMRVNESGVLEDFLAQKCGNTHYFLCDFRGQTFQGDDFIFNPKSPLNVRGWVDSKVEDDAILYQVFSSPAFIFKFAKDSLVRSGRLFFTMGMDAFPPYGGDSFTSLQIAQFLPAEFVDYELSRQSQGQFKNVEKFSMLFTTVAWLSVFFIAAVFSKRLLKATEELFIYQLLAFLIVNACVTATFAGVYGRFQDRVAWLLFLAALIVCSKKFTKQLSDDTGV